jgi:DNA-3-methyladenine glycosylase
MKLGLSFYDRPAVVVAREMLGQVLVHQVKDVRRAVRVVETEAYAGPHDLACHASKGRTPRAEVLFGPPGRAYVYFVYGMHHCFNVVVEPEGVGAAVLIRGVEPLEGLPAGVRTDGPAKLCRALGITLRDNRTSLVGEGHLWLESAPVPSRRAIARGPRIGVDYAGIWARKPYRFWVRGSSGVSRGPRSPKG